MTIKEFTEAAIQGGWLGLNTFVALTGTVEKTSFEVVDCFGYYGQCWSVKRPLCNDFSFKIEQLAMDPKAWEAVGKVKGWGTTGHEQSGGLVPPVMILGRYDRLSLGSIMWSVPQFYMHRMIDSLYEGKTLEEYIATL